MHTRVKTATELDAMRIGGHMLATILQTLRAATAPGCTPLDMSALAARELRALGGEPAFKGYHGFPDIICISVNNQVQHSIPSNIQLQAGDVVNYDFGVRYKGMITDAGISVGVGGSGATDGSGGADGLGGGLSADAQRLLSGTEAALAAGVAAISDGVRVGDISAAVEAVLTKHRLGIVRDLVGHGVGHELHEEPNIPNYGKAGRGPILKSGMTICVEPITTLGSYKIMEDDDGWTLWTVDGSWSAQFEHTILVTDDGAEILTIG